MLRFRVSIVLLILILPVLIQAFGSASYFDCLHSYKNTCSKSRIKSNYQDVRLVVSNQRRGVKLHLKSKEYSSSDDEDPLRRNVSVSVGMIAQPIVWVSLYFVASTGAGLPSGPFGLIGALEGISYLVIVAVAGKDVYRTIVGKRVENQQVRPIDSVVTRLSYVSVFAGLVVLASLVLKQGCVPNAKPILDYSDYLPICDTTPGIFGA
jgi:hypothetical protein